jgi:heterodisulfide reductase subunit A
MKDSESAEGRIGVFICECGPNIRDTMDIPGIREYAARLRGVVLARQVPLLCSGEGQAAIRDDIVQHSLTRIVIAACSPREHEHTFKKVLTDAGLNPFLMQFVNIREQCAWVIRDKSVATRKAKALIRAAAGRVALHEPLEIRRIDYQMDVLVAGAGIAGIYAALTLARKGRKVYLIEKSPVIGGKVAQYEKVFPNLECASCMLDPVLDNILHNESIELLTLSEVRDVVGYFGNFSVTVSEKARYVDAATCIGCGACVDACPVSVLNEFNGGLDYRKAISIPYPGSLPHIAVIDKENCLHFHDRSCSTCSEACPFGSVNFEDTGRIREVKTGAIILATGFDVFDPARAPAFGYGKISNVYTSLQFERVVNSTGPTEGKILMTNGKPPSSIALVHCVGSRTREFNEYCSGICCMNTLKFARMIREQIPDCSITEFFTDFCLPGKASQEFLNNMPDSLKPEFIRIKSADTVALSEEKGAISLSYEDVNGIIKQGLFDMAVLSVAVEASRDARDIAGVFDIPLGRDGFFQEEHVKLSPVSTVKDGVYIAGCAQGPKDIQSSVAQGVAAAGLVLSRLIPGEKMAIEPMIAAVDETLCSGCRVCAGLCPYKAITYNEKENVAVINDVLCRGCGVCASACPAAAINARHFTDKQVMAEIAGLLEQVNEQV